MSEKILITGVDGFLGGAMFDTVKNSNREVVGTVLKETELTEKLGVVRLDITNREETVKLICDKKPEIIANFAGIAAPAVVRDNPDLAYSVNVNGVLNIIYGVLAARSIDPDYKPTILGAGSIEEYGNGLTDENGEPLEINENTSSPPINLYGEQKKEAGQKALELCQLNNIRMYWVIQGNAMGAPDYANLTENPIHLRHGQEPGFFVPDVAKQIAEIEKSGKEQAFLTTGHIEHQRNFVYGEDAVKAYLALAEEKPAPGKYIVCANKSISLQEILKTLVDFSYVDITHKIDESKGSVGKSRIYSNSNIKNATGWEPVTPIQKALKTALEDQRRRLR